MKHPLVSTHDLSFRYDEHRIRKPHGREWLLEGLNVSFNRASALGIVGESGSGKSTLIRLLCGLLPAGSGTVTFEGRSLSNWLSQSPQSFRSRNQMIYQNPASSFDPRMQIHRALAEPVRAIERRRPAWPEMEEWLSNVGLRQEVMKRYPHQLSGGQLQRVSIARALSLGPAVLYADEPTSSLDVSVQAQVLNLLMDLRLRLGLTVVLVSHDLAVVSRTCDQILVMKEGEIVDSGDISDVLQNPSSPYTTRLITAAQAVGIGSKDLHPRTGQPGNASNGVTRKWGT